MKKFLLTAMAVFLLLPAGAEKIIARYKDRVISTETGKAPIPSFGFYVFKPAQTYRGKKVVFRMDIKRIEGEAPLGATFRCSTKPGGLRVHNSFNFEYKATGETAAAEAVVDIPDLDNISQFNLHTVLVGVGFPSRRIKWRNNNLRSPGSERHAAKLG